MAITKRATVSFSIKAVLPSVDEGVILKELMAAAKAIHAGEIKPDARQSYILKLWLTEGIDAVVENIIRYQFRSMVKEAMQDYADAELFRTSPATVRFFK